MDLETIWQMREEEVYPAIFGPVGRGVFPLTKEIFVNRFGQEEIDPRWLTYGVNEFAPTAERKSWLYVTSGHSNPWEQRPEEYDPAGESGAGVEFTFSVSEQGDWAVQVLQNIVAYDLLLRSGPISGAGGFALFDRIPMRAPLNGQPECKLRNLVLVEREDGQQEFCLPSGLVILVGFTGITDDELAFAKQHGSPALIDKLRNAGYHPVTDPTRDSLVF